MHTQSCLQQGKCGEQGLCWDAGAKDTAMQMLPPSGLGPLQEGISEDKAHQHGTFRAFFSGFQQ